MHIVIAQMSHETNTFSPVPTDLARFSGPRFQALLRRMNFPEAAETSPGA